MLASLKKGATAAAAVLALAAAVEISLVNTAAAGAKTKADILIESIGNKASDEGKGPGKSKGKVEYTWKVEEGEKSEPGGRGLAGRTARICCVIPGAAPMLTTPHRCKTAGGKKVSLKKCPHVSPAPQGDVTLKRGVIGR